MSDTLEKFLALFKKDGDMYPLAIIITVLLALILLFVITTMIRCACSPRLERARGKALALELGLDPTDKEVVRNLANFSVLIASTSVMQLSVSKKSTDDTDGQHYRLSRRFTVGWCLQALMHKLGLRKQCDLVQLEEDVLNALCEVIKLVTSKIAKETAEAEVTDDTEEEKKVARNIKANAKKNRLLIALQHGVLSYFPKFASVHANEHSESQQQRKDLVNAYSDVMLEKLSMDTVQSVNILEALLDRLVTDVQVTNAEFPAEVSELPQVKRVGKKFYAMDQEKYNHVRDMFGIFAQTMGKRALRTVVNVWRALKIIMRLNPEHNKFSYFSTSDGDEHLYEKNHPPVPELPSGDGTVVQWCTHSTVWCQNGPFTAVTDPILGDINPIMYPARTKPGFQPEQASVATAILISHNHRDHTDVASLKRFLPYQPVMLVPEGNKKLFESLGFTEVHEVDWFKNVTVTVRAGMRMECVSVPALHWSGRGAFGTDANYRTSVCGWVIRFPDEPTQPRVYYAGDTAVLPETYIRSVAHVVYQDVIEDLNNEDSPAVPLLINLQPGGPNYDRSNMQSSHQSVMDSVNTQLEIALSCYKINTGETCIVGDPAFWIKKVATIIVHRGTFELGPDRCEENELILESAIGILGQCQSLRDLYNMWDQYKEQAAGENSSKYLFTRQQDTYSGNLFIIQGLVQLWHNALRFTLSQGQLDFMGDVEMMLHNKSENLKKLPQDILTELDTLSLTDATLGASKSTTNRAKDLVTRVLQSVSMPKKGEQNFVSVNEVTGRSYDLPSNS